MIDSTGMQRKARASSKAILAAIVISLGLHALLGFLEHYEVHEVPSGSSSVRVSLQTSDRVGDIADSQANVSIDSVQAKKKVDAKTKQAQKKAEKISAPPEEQAAKSSEPPTKQLTQEAPPSPEVAELSLVKEQVAKKQPAPENTQSEIILSRAKSTKGISPLDPTQPKTPVSSELHEKIKVHEKTVHETVERKTEASKLADARDQEQETSEKERVQDEQEQTEQTLVSAPKPTYSKGSASNPEPLYPVIASRRGWEGTVVIGVNVDEEGAIIDKPLIIQSSHIGVLDYAAFDTVRESWRFEPALVNGMPVASYVEIPFTFQLR